MVDAAALQGVVQVAGPVGRQDDDRALVRPDGADLGNRHAPFREELEEKGFELVVGPVDLIDEKHRRAGPGVVDGPQ